MPYIQEMVYHSGNADLSKCKQVIHKKGTEVVRPRRVEKRRYILRNGVKKYTGPLKALAKTGTLHTFQPRLLVFTELSTQGAARTDRYIL